MSSSTEMIQSPFLDISSFDAEESEGVDELEAPSTLYGVKSPFRSIYKLEEQTGMIDPEAEEFASFMAELYEREFDDAVLELVNEAADFYESRFVGEYGSGLAVQGIKAERLLEEHFAPLVTDVERLLESIAQDIEGRDLGTMLGQEPRIVPLAAAYIQST